MYQKDFNKYVNGTWFQENEIPDDQNTWGTFSILNDKSLKDSLTIVQALPSNNPIKILYDKAMDSEKNIEDISHIVKEIRNTDKNNLIVLFAKLRRLGIKTPLSLYVSEDSKNTSILMPYIGTSGIRMAREHYLDEDKADVRYKYVEYMENMIHEYDPDMSFDSQAILKIETDLARSTRTSVEQRDPELNYNKTTIEQWSKHSGINGRAYLNTLCPGKKIDILIVDNPEFYQDLSIIMNKYPIGDWINYCIFSCLHSYY